MMTPGDGGAANPNNIRSSQNPMQSIEIRQTDILAQFAYSNANERVLQYPVSINDQGRRNSWHLDVACDNRVENMSVIRVRQ